ncbi:MAG TPA: lysine--tRNA ligase [Gordonia polyisoprenivorans]|uniref:bifunctional lysylphosphatidylglycerol synthetase/lysine--tRNA ligase LysX n=1 Tax=Gordonia polyisoprenivorans TaxID=84595 RepID=UPI000EBEED95|nr:bifunctional lysylphosphatidylglycerol synthetase/lysine--tRNA ligase LysX [Gordonia polyisoprenivorans]QUD82430.1 bifunctional lysylphosphatidylglycerol synthetase/lysine--tRNA ligase LysX [Gordonia polyisoprenivorans]HCS58401.1 lysine--tRNA ligase [Gordonia polyisoprenivorans]
MAVETGVQQAPDDEKQHGSVPPDRTAAERRSADLLDQIRHPRGFGHNAPRIAGTVVGVMAAIALASSVFPFFRHWIHIPRDYVDNYIVAMPETSFAWAYVLALVAIALAARKRIAWWICVILLVLFMLTNALLLIPAIGSDLDMTRTERINTGIGLAIQVAILFFLVLTFRQFYTRVRRAALLRALGVLITGLVVATMLGWGLVVLVPGSLESGERLPYAFNRVVAFATIDQRTFDGHHTHPWINGLLGLFGALALIAAAIVLFRSQRLKSLITAEDERLIRALIDRFGDDDSLAYFSTRRDKAVVFSLDGRAAITYRVELGVGLAGGDPIGDPDSWSGAIAEFLTLCERYGWHPAAMGASERGAEAYDAAGFGTLNIGDEAIIHTRDFTLSGPAMKSVRQAVTRNRRAGVTVRIRRHSELSEAQMAEAIARADAWRDTDEERGFAMALSRLGDPADGNCLLVEAIQNEGTDDEKVIGLLSFVPWGRRGVSLDLMRRDRNGVNGVVETMVVELCQRAEQVGVTDISLNFATFRAFFEHGGQIGAGPVMRASYSALMFGSRFFQMESLYRSNAKYLPDWQPRYLCFEDARMLPRAGLASIVTEGFVRLPRFGRKEQYEAGEPSVPQGVDVDALVAQFAEEADQQAVSVHRPEQVRVRMAKLDRLIAEGFDPYPPADAPTHTIAAARELPQGTQVTIAGRITRLRDFGKVIFADLHDWSGQVQLLIEDSRIIPGTPDFGSDVDLGDLVEVRGMLGESRKGELSVLIDAWRINGKCLRPLPDKWAGLTDPEARVRQRYLDLATNARSRDLLKTRSIVVKALRDFLATRDFLEVETPILQRIHGGANATPFQTHINAYNLDLYLRIAPELYLKRLCVGGVEKVYEIGRNFRNEGVDFSHNPEFTSLEAYEAHSDYLKMLDLTREMIQFAATAAHGEPVIYRTGDDGTVERIDISGDWPAKTVHEVVSEGAGEEVTPETSAEDLRRICDRLEIAHRPDWDAGALVLELYEHLGEDRTTFPTFYIDFPTSTSPLTRAHRSRAGVAERWDLVAWGVELGTAYTELTDPVEQRKRLTAQSILAADGDPEAMELDEDFLEALEYAMPPTGGLGVGVDRVVMLITGQSIRESLPFPLVKPDEG